MSNKKHNKLLREADLSQPQIDILRYLVKSDDGIGSRHMPYKDAWFKKSQEHISLADVQELHNKGYLFQYGLTGVSARYRISDKGRKLTDAV